MTESEYLNVILAYTEAFNTVFNIWLTVTFSYLVAFYFIVARLDNKLRKVLISLYTAASVIFTIRYIILVVGTGRFSQRMVEAGYESIYQAFPGQQLLSLGGTFLLMIVGTIVAVVYSISHSRGSK